MNSIDAVISWVDGYDFNYQQKLKSFCIQQGIEKNIAVDPTRIQQCNEIHYCLRSLSRFAPWIRTIYIITNQQVPQAALDFQGSTVGNKIKIIDQNDLLNEFNANTPVFNSLSIEWLIWRIKGLSNQFLYFNDNFFIIRDVTPDDFFRNNCMVLRGKWKTQSEQKTPYLIKKYLSSWFTKGKEIDKSSLTTNPHRGWQEKSARLAGFDKHFYLLPHAPFPLIKKTFDDYITQKPELFTDNVSYPFRHPEQVSSIPLMVHLDIKHKRVIYDSSSQSIMVNGACHSLKKIKHRLQRTQHDQKIAFVCIQSIDQAPPETQRYMLDWLQHTIG